MTPSGGINPHDKFRIRANRTEILFADYILEHLTPNGKAGFVVPEGIIFQGSGDFTELRKWILYEAGLWAVVSLPSQIFQPYSGVKTSILLIDREVARTRSEILLVKIENDGFSLNTNRAPIKENDLPDALHWLDMCKKELEHFKIEIENQSENRLTKKLRLLHKDEFARLDNYKSASSAFSFCRKLYDKTVKAKKEFETKIELENTVKKEVKEKSKKEKCDTNIADLKDKIDKVLADFYKKTSINFLPETEEELKTWFDDTLKSAAIEYGVNLKNNQVLTKQILDALDHERDYNLNFDKFSQMSLLSSEYELVSVGDLCELGRGRVISKETIDKNKGIYPVYSSQTSNDGIFGYLDTFDFDGEYVTWTTDGANAGTVFYRTGKFNCTNVCGTLKAKSNKVLMKYLAVVLNEIAPAFVVKLGNPKLMNNVMEKIQIPLPPIEVQQKVINEVSGYENIIKGCDLIINNYKPTIEVDEDWEKIELGELAENLDSKRVPITEKDRVKGDIPYYGASGIVDYVKHYLFDEELLLVSEDGANLLTRTQPIAFSVNGKCWVNNHAHILRFKNRTSQKWVEIYINNTDISNYVTGAAQPKLNQANLNGLIIPFPSLETQEKIINELEFEFETMRTTALFKSKMNENISKIINKVFGK